jgi:hypothetical protein
MLRGILIFAIKHPYYGRYAYNLAVTIKAVENIPIAVVYDDSSMNHLSGDQLKVFDKRIHAPESIQKNCGAKLWAYEMTPFEHTLVLDADMLWLPKKKPSELLDILEGSPFTAITEGCTDHPTSHYFFWAEVDEIRAKYGVDKIYQWRTEVMYFEKGKKAKKLFDDARAIHANPNLKVKTFAEGIPDELAINIAAAIGDIHPHADRWQPSYWPQLFQNRVPEPATLYRDYYLLSVGGNHTTENVKLFYNRLVKAQAPKIGQGHCFPVQSKHSFLTERRKS